MKTAYIWMACLSVMLVLATAPAQAQSDVLEREFGNERDDLIEDGKAVLCFFNPNASVCREDRQQPSARGAGNGGGGSSNATRPAAAPNPAREQLRASQNALNGTGFDAGYADGKMGPRTRGAINDYQAHMGYPQTGRLSDTQREELLRNVARIQSGEAAREFPRVAEVEGEKGLLKALQDPDYARNRYGPSPGEDEGTGEIDVTNVQPVDQIDDIPTDRGTTVSEDTVSLPPLNLPSPKVIPAGGSMTEHCLLTQGMTQIDGAVLVGSPQNADQALDEQFCDARTYAITKGSGLRSKLGLDPSTMNGFCRDLADRLAPALASVPSGDTKAVAGTAREIIDSLFKSQATLVSTYGEICLGVGYRLDEPKIALSATAIMLAEGKLPYGELFGHHVRRGFGTSGTEEASKSWYVTAISAMEQGADPAFLPSKSEQRNTIIKGAIGMANEQFGSLELPKID